MGETLTRWHVYFSGGVQGVGFRFTAQHFAQELGLTGWVRNLTDGRVEMEAQGPAEQLQDHLARLHSAPLIRIDHYDVQEIPVKPGEKRFSVLHTWF